MTKLKRPSLKQKLFAKKFIENGGNATEAALTSYNVTTRESAKHMGMQALDNPMVQEEIKKLLNKSGLDLDTIAGETREALTNALKAKPTFNGGVNLLQFLFKLHGVSPLNKSIAMKWSRTQNIPSQDITELTRQLKQLNNNTNKLLFNKNNINAFSFFYFSLKL